MSKNQEIYSTLRCAGLTEAGAFAVMGNWDCESNLEAGRLQGDFNPFRTSSKNYVARITSGALDKESFANDQKGFGLAQWTLAYRKRKLYDFWKSSGRSLDDPIMQTQFAIHELKTEGEYAGLFQLLKTSDDLYVCTDGVCRKYERPAVNNVEARYASAQKIKQTISAKDVPIVDLETTQPVEDRNDVHVMPTHEFWPPRVVCAGMTGADIKVLHTLLEVWGYGVTDALYDFGSFLETKVKEFQTDHGLKADGIVGPLTWTALLNTNKN